MQLGAQGQLLAYVLPGQTLPEAQGARNWWLRAEPFALNLQPPGLGAGWSFEFSGALIRPGHPQGERPTRALARLLNHGLLVRNHGLSLEDLNKLLSAGRHWQLWLPPLLQAEELAGVRSHAACFLLAEMGFQLQSVALQQAAMSTPPWRRGEAAEPGHRFSRTDLKMLQAEEEQLARRVFEELPELAGTMGQQAQAAITHDGLRPLWREVDQLARSVNRFPAPLDEDSRLLPLALHESVRALRAAWGAMEAMRTTLEQFGLRHGETVGERAGKPLEHSPALVALRRQYAILAAAIALRCRKGETDVAGMPLAAPASLPEPEPGAAGRECRVLVLCGSGRQITVQAASLPEAPPGGIKVLAPAAGQALRKPLQQALRQARAQLEASASLPPALCFHLTWPGAADEPAPASASELEFALVLADAVLGGRLGPMPEQLLTIPLRIDWETRALQASRQSMRPALEDLESLLARQPGAMVFLPLAEDAETAATQEKIRTCAGGLHTPANLGELQGRMARENPPGQRRVQVFFPVVGGAAAELFSLVLSLRKIGAEKESGHDEGCPLLIQGGLHDVGRRQRLGELLAAAREADQDPHFSSQWETRVTFSGSFSGDSWELALVLADRLARRRLAPSHGRLLASGAIALSAAELEEGRLFEPLAVREVAGMAPKLELLLALAAPGDRILLPAAWRPRAEAQTFMRACHGKGALPAFVPAAA